VFGGHSGNLEADDQTPFFFNTRLLIYPAE